MSSPGEDLRIRQGYPLKAKVHLTLQKIREFYEARNGKVYVSFSGGKDSQVLLHLVRSIYPEVVAVFSNTGLEYPEIVEHVKTFDNVEILRPKLTFRQVIEQHGYAVGSKLVARTIRDLRRDDISDDLRRIYMEGINRKGEPAPRWKLAQKWHGLIDAPFKVSEKCCDALKKSPFKRYEKETGLAPYLGIMAEESGLRKLAYERVGCNSLGGRRDMSSPMAFWTGQDVLQYALDNGLKFASVYGEIVCAEDGALQTELCDRTGCMWCLFGIDKDSKAGKLNRIQRLAVTHPQIHKYCTTVLGLDVVMDYLGVPWKIPEQQKPWVYDEAEGF